MKKAITIIGLFTLMLVVTSFTTPNEIGGSKEPKGTINVLSIGGSKEPRFNIGGSKEPKGIINVLSIGGSKEPKSE